MPYDFATICIKGHVLDMYEKNSQKYCDKCGSITISACQHCNADIRGKEYWPDVIGSGEFIFPYYCHSCGNPLPWTENLLNNAVELLSLDENIDNKTAEIIRNAIPDLIVETPSTPVAVAKYKKYIGQASQLVKDSLYKLLVDVVSASIKKSLFEWFPTRQTIIVCF